jgi:hypothetical protein
MTYREARSEWELEFFRKAITKHRGNVSHTAKAIGMFRPELSVKLKRYGLNPAEIKKQSRVKGSVHLTEVPKEPPTVVHFAERALYAKFAKNAEYASYSEWAEFADFANQERKPSQFRQFAEDSIKEGKRNETLNSNSDRDSSGLLSQRLCVRR